MKTKSPKFATINIDETRQTPRVGIEFDMTPAVHYRWNIVNAARTIVETPSELEITIKVYELHKGILRNKGVPEEVLEKGDERLVQRVKRLARLRQSQD